jgi:hypothetical protein
MLIHEKLDKIAESRIPDSVHKYLHVNCREAWVQSVFDLYKKEAIRLDKDSLEVLAKNWESLLYQKYSYLN